MLIVVVEMNLLAVVHDHAAPTARRTVRGIHGRSTIALMLRTVFIACSAVVAELAVMTARSRMQIERLAAGATFHDRFTFCADRDGFATCDQLFWEFLGDTNLERGEGSQSHLSF